MTGQTAAYADTVAGQLRRRREASWRLPPLPDGRRDPLDALADWSREPLPDFAAELRHLGLLTGAVAAELKAMHERVA
jgi:hypothetical protein